MAELVARPVDGRRARRVGPADRESVHAMPILATDDGWIDRLGGGVVVHEDRLDPASHVRVRRVEGPDRYPVLAIAQPARVERILLLRQVLAGDRKGVVAPARVVRDRA